MSEKKWTSEDMSAAVERALQTMEGVALELYRRGREPLLEELETVKRERGEARASCPDCAMWAERSARWHDDMQRAERERDEARVSAADQFRRGADAMRKRCAMWVKHNSHEDGIGMGSQRMESALAALPIPEEP